MQTNPFYTQIEAYLLGSLTAAEIQKFEKEMKMDTQLALAVNEYKIAFQAVDLLVEDELSQKLKGLQKERYAQKKVRRIDISQRTLAIAASVLLLLVAGFGLFQNQQYSNGNLAAAYFEKSDGGGDRGNEAGFLAFEKGEYSATIAAFSKVVENDAQYSEAQFYMGQANFKLGNYEVAKANFRKVIRANDVRYGDGAKWDMALSHLALGEEAEAKVILNEFVENETPLYSGKAAGVLGDLEVFWRF